MKIKKNISLWKVFVFNISLVIVLFTAALFVGIYINNEKSIKTQLKMQAQTLFNSIVLARKWNAGYGGVFVEKKAGMRSNPYLKNSDITATSGKTYTQKNPALMTREISEIATSEGIFAFHITSLKPLNPLNKPDQFERKALFSFEKGVPEKFTRVSKEGSRYYRYIAPLHVEESCMLCHRDQGYHVGDIRGGISVTFKIDRAEKSLKINRYLVIGIFIITALSFLGIVYQMVIRLKRKLDEAEARIREMAVTDELTKLKNRRYVLGRLSEEQSQSVRYKRPLSCIMFDIDNFKNVNDTYGHDAGDAVLKAVSDVVAAQCRSADTLGRYGGEEFLMVLPETELEGAQKFADRIRLVVENLRVTIPSGMDLHVTASFGVASYIPSQGNTVMNMEVLIKRTDEALYRAKAAGRNRVEVAL